MRREKRILTQRKHETKEIVRNLLFASSVPRGRFLIPDEEAQRGPAECVLLLRPMARGFNLLQN